MTRLLQSRTSLSPLPQTVPLFLRTTFLRRFLFRGEPQRQEQSGQAEARFSSLRIEHSLAAVS